MRETDLNDLLLSLLKGGEKEKNQAVSLLYKHCYPKARLIAKNRGLSEFWLDDAFQIAVLNFLPKSDQVSSNVAGYFYSILSRKCLYLKKMEEVYSRNENFPNKEALAAFQRKKWANNPRNLLGKLGDKCKKMVFMRFWEEKSFDAIGLEMGYADRNSAFTIFKRCIAKIKKNSELQL